MERTSVMTSTLRRATRPRSCVLRALVLLVVATSPAGAASVAPGHPSPTPPAGRSHLLVIVGAAGDETYREVFHRWALQLVDAARDDLGLADEQITYLGEKPDMAPDRITARSTRENVELIFQRLADNTAPDDEIFIVLIGHGSGNGEQSKFNIPGRDLNAVEYDALLDRFVTQRIAFINTASASGDFIDALSGPNRAVVTATRDAAQNNQTVFPRFFIEAFSAEVADLDKNERVSLLEAYSYASIEVKRFYEDDGRMLTETSQIDDNGDGEGSHEPDMVVADGGFARGLFLDNVGAVTVTATDDPEMNALLEAKTRLSRQIEELKLMKDSMNPELYATELEKLLVDLALKDREIRAKGRQ